MRLIDADALLETLESVYWARENESKYTGNRAITVTWNDAIVTIKSAPTIHPERKKGHWIRHPEQRNIFNGKTIECSECHEKYTVQYVEDELFCRHCGADMRGEE